MSELADLLRPIHPSIYTLLMIDAGAIEVMRRCPEGHVVEFVGRNADVDTTIRPCATRNGELICLVCGWIEQPTTDGS